MAAAGDTAASSGPACAICGWSPAGQGDASGPNGACPTCGAGPLARRVAASLLRRLTGQDGALRALPPGSVLTGLGLEDAEPLAAALARAFAYANLALQDGAPHGLRKRLPAEPCLQADFVLCLDRLQYLETTVAEALDGLAALLRPGGVLVLAVPPSDGTEIAEFGLPPSSSRLVEIDGRCALLHLAPQGGFVVTDVTARIDAARTHLVLREIPAASLEDHLRAAGFTDIARISGGAEPLFVCRRGAAAPEPERAAIADGGGTSL